MENLLPITIEMRALKNMEAGMQPIEAVQKAIEEENRMLFMVAYGVDIETGRLMKDVSKEIQSTLCRKVYTRLRETI